jgi:hypothetical protein
MPTPISLPTSGRATLHTTVRSATKRVIAAHAAREGVTLGVALDQLISQLTTPTAKSKKSRR